MARSYYRPLRSPEDLQSIFALDLREADVEEIKASTGYNPVEALRFSIDLSEKVWVVIHEDKIEGVFGVVRKETGGVPWFVATDKFKEFRWTFAKESKKLVKELLEEYGTLANFVMASHKESIKWLEWLGFKLSLVTFPLCDPNVLFHYFVMEKGDSE